MPTKLKISYKGKHLGTWDVNEIEMDDALRLEDQTGMTVDELAKSFVNASARGYQAMLWFLSQGTDTPLGLHEKFKFGDVDTEVVPDPTPAPVIELAPAADVTPSSSAARGGSPSSRTTSA